jgi:antitoxin CptB
MSGSEPERLDLDARRRRLRFRAWHRGMREMDLILGRFCDREIDRLSEADIDELEDLMERPDQEVYGWICDPASTPGAVSSPLFDRLRTSAAPANGRS